MSKLKRVKAQAKSWYPDPALVRKRIAEMNRAFESSFPDRKLPNNGLGRKWARYMMRTKRLYPGPRDYLWLESWCPWMVKSERAKMLGSKGHWYSGSSLGQHLEVDNAMRNELRLWTMRPNNVEWTEVQSQRNERDYMKKQEKRHANGVKARRKGAAEPWIALGMSKATYYRKKLHLSRETPESALSPPIGTADSRVSQAEAAATSPTTLSQPLGPDRLPGNSVADHRNHLDPGIRPGGIRDRALNALASTTPSKRPDRPYQEQEISPAMGTGEHSRSSEHEGSNVIPLRLKRAHPTRQPLAA